jgi:hypothetical protein
MRAMAILYLGIADPDFERDYYVSPILAPSSLLAQFPTILLTCGEKDPFVDDTVIFAGRVREAKRALKATMQMEVAGKSAKYGEGLRMSVASPDNPKARILYETEEDWIQMEIYEGWSHGYLQMAALMREAREAIVDLGKWIDEAFIMRGKRLPTPPVSSGRKADTKSPIRSAFAPTSPSARRGSSSRRQKPDLGHVLASSETETEPEGLMMPTRRRRSPPPSFGSETTETPSSSETIAVTATPVPATPTPMSSYKVGAKGLDEAELIRRRRAEAAVERL